MNRARDLPLWAAMVVLIVATAGAFSPVLSCNFTSWDDFDTIARNPRLNPPTPRSLEQFWTSSQMDLYIPLTYTLWAGVAEVARLPAPRDGSCLDPLPFHVLNLALHIAAALAVLMLLRLLFRSNLAAMIGALLFALHPVQVEPVAWTSGTKDVLSALLSLLAIGTYLRAVAGRDDSTPGTSKSRIGIYLLATALFILAMFAKPSAMMVPGIVIVLDWLLLRRPLRRVLWRIFPWVVLSIACAMSTWHFQPAVGSAADAPPIWIRPLIAFDALAFYLYKMLFPIALGIDYGRMPQRAIAQGWIHYTWIAPAIVAVAAALIWKRSRAPAIAAMILLIVLIPVLGLVPFDFQGYSTVADHYLYLAMLGPALLAAWAVMRWPKTPVFIIAAFALSSLGIRSFAQARVWQDSQTLFSNALAVNPKSFAAYDSLAAGAIERQDWPGAIALARRAIQCEPGYSRSQVLLGRALIGAGEIQDAERAFRTALRVRSDDPAALNNLAALLAQQGRFDEAIPLARRAAAIEPLSVDPQLNLGKMYLAAKQSAKARRQFQIVLKLNPTNAEARELMRQVP